jgi:hypothetical protein
MEWEICMQVKQYIGKAYKKLAAGSYVPTYVYLYVESKMWLN